MRLQISLATFVVLLVSVPVGTKATPQSAGSQRVTKTLPATCPVTIPRKAPLMPFEQFLGYAMAHWHGKFYVGAL